MWSEINVLLNERGPTPNEKVSCEYLSQQKGLKKRDLSWSF